MLKRFLILTLLFCTGCALPPPDITGQKLVPEIDISAVRYVREGIHYMALGRYLDGEIKFQKALLLEPGAERILENIAVSHFMQERYDEALLEFQSLYSKDPLALPLLMWVGKTTATMGRYEEGIELLKKGFQQSIDRPDDAVASSFARAIAVLYFKMGDEEQSACYSSTAMSLAPTAVEVYKHSRILLALGYPTNAKTLVNTFLGPTTSASRGRTFAEVLALANFSEGNDNETLEAVKEGALFPSDDADLNYELKLTTILLIDKMKSQGKELEVEPIDQTVLTDMLQDLRLEGAMPLYWPKTFIDAVIELQKKTLSE